MSNSIIYVLFLANQVQYHDVAYLAAGESRFLSDVSEVGGASAILIRLHGAFMLVAWIGTASIGILLARYYRQTWVGSQLCGKDLWFAVCKIIFLNRILDRSSKQRANGVITVRESFISRPNTDVCYVDWPGYIDHPLTSVHPLW